MSVNGYTFNEDNARQAINKRWQAARQAASQGLSKINKSQSSLNAWASIVEYQARLAINPDIQTRDTTNAAVFVGRATGYIPSQIDMQAQDNPNGGMNIHISGDIATKLVQLLDKKRLVSDNNNYTKHKHVQIVDV
jgi:hypothetical protein